MISAALMTATASTEQAGVLSLVVSMLPLVLVIVVMYFILIRPQKKKEKEVAKMRNNLQVGDEIVTAGGIVGRVVSLREDTLLIETAATTPRSALSAGQSSPAKPSTTTSDFHSSRILFTIREKGVVICRRKSRSKDIFFQLPSVCWQAVGLQQQ